MGYATPEIAAAKRREYVKNNKEKVKEAKRVAWANLSREEKDKVNAYRRELYKKEKEKKKQYRADNSEKIKKYLADYRAKNRVALNEQCALLNRKALVEISKSYIANMLKVSTKELSDDYYFAHREMLKLKRLIKEMK